VNRFSENISNLAVRWAVDPLCPLFDNDSQTDLHNCLKEYVPEYKPFQKTIAVPAEDSAVFAKTA
jgi:hypothetical protein